MPRRRKKGRIASEERTRRLASMAYSPPYRRSKPPATFGGGFAAPAAPASFGAPAAGAPAVAIPAPTPATGGAGSGATPAVFGAAAPGGGGRFAFGAAAAPSAFGAAPSPPAFGAAAPVPASVSGRGRFGAAAAAPLAFAAAPAFGAAQGDLRIRCRYGFGPAAPAGPWLVRGLWVR